jgi:uncharacterized membrane protein YgdD (TMEM256/DUF423 family)
MSEGTILAIGIIVFSLTMIGLALTIREFRQAIYPLDERDD